jgi:hypothetical protein
MGSADNYRQQADEAAARVDWCEKKLSFERKRRKALNDLAANEDWLDGKVDPMPRPRSRKALRAQRDRLSAVQIIGFKSRAGPFVTRAVIFALPTY